MSSEERVEEPASFPGLKKGGLSLRLIDGGSPRDFESMGRWLTDRRVLRFYGGEEDRVDADQAAREYHPEVLFRERVWPLIIEWKEASVGYLQFYPVEDGEEYGLEAVDADTYAMDLFLGVPEIWGQGVGTTAVGLVVDFLFERLGASRVLIDPHVDNSRAVRAYEKCGFEIVELLEKHELQDGTWRDAWLMEICADRFG